MSPALLELIIKYGPELLGRIFSMFRTSIGECHFCNKKIGGSEEATFELADNSFILCCKRPVCQTLLKLKMLGESSVH